MQHQVSEVSRVRVPSAAQLADLGRPRSYLSHVRLADKVLSFPITSLPYQPHLFKPPFLTRLFQYGWPQQTKYFPHSRIALPPASSSPADLQPTALAMDPALTKYQSALQPHHAITREAQL